MHLAGGLYMVQAASMGMVEWCCAAFGFGLEVCGKFHPSPSIVCLGQQLQVDTHTHTHAHLSNRSRELIPPTK